MVNDGQMDKTNYNFNNSQIQYNQSSLIQNNHNAIRLLWLLTSGDNNEFWIKFVDCRSNFGD